jgi:hypothetical protein
MMRQQIFMTSPARLSLMPRRIVIHVFAPRHGLNSAAVYFHSS